MNWARYRILLPWVCAAVLLPVGVAMLVVRYGGDPYDQVEPGMTLDQVARVLGGRGLSCVGDKGPREEFQETRLWEADGGEILVTFDDGRVVSKRFAEDRYASGRPKWSFQRALHRLGF